MKRDDLEIFIQKHLIEEGWAESEFAVKSVNVPVGANCNLTYIIAGIVEAYLNSKRSDIDVVLAQDKNGKVIFMKTFNESEREDMLKTYDYVRELPNCSYRMCGIERLIIEDPYANEA